MMVDRKARYEYRVWGNKFEKLRDQLQRLARKSLERRPSEEIYLISPKTDACNAKIRRGRLNLKALLATELGLELWKPLLDAEFPLNRSVIAGQLFSQLKLKVPELRKPRYLADDFLRDIVQAQPKLLMMSVVKKRTRFELDACLAEFTLVNIGKTAFKTVAVESIEADRVLQLVRQLHIGKMPNTSYIRQLKQLLGNGKSQAFVQGSGPRTRAR